MQTKTKNRLTITLTIIFFALPVVVAYLMTSGWIDYQPSSTKNNGHFVSPPVKLENYSDSEWVKTLPGHWTLIHRVPYICDLKCEEIESELHRYRLTLGHRSDKLNLVMLADGYITEYPDHFPHVLKVSMAKEQDLEEVMDSLSEISMKNGEGMYVVAPEGYLMLAFTEDNTSTQIIKDLSLLVKRKGE